MFDASAKCRGGVSLNECLERGWNLIEVIPELLDRFRQNPMGITADIEKAFLQLSVNPKHRDFLRFYHPNGEIYRHKRVVFGVTSSPFLLGAVLGLHLSRMRSAYPDAVRLMERSFYVDNLITSVNTIDEYQALRNEATAVMMKGQMNLRCWVSNVDKDRPDDVTRVLGLVCHLDRDTLACTVSKIEQAVGHVFTKREMLAITNQDPIGFVCLVLLPPKLMLQEAWVQRLKWDEAVPDSLNSRFTKWVNQIDRLDEIEIPRWLGKKNDVQLHVFADASKDAYAACIFARSVYKDKVKVTLLRAKSRLAPKFATIPRLELMACLIAVRLYKSTTEALSLSPCDSLFWTDSTSVLWWIKEEGNWEVFVRNRVREIRQLSDPEKWYHIPGQHNPADIPSRGCNVMQLLSSRWWEGPDWLGKAESEWPVGTLLPLVVDRDPEEVVLAGIVASVSHPFDRLRECSNVRKIIRVIAWIFRYFTNRIPMFRKGEPRIADPFLRCQEIKRAERALWRYVQRQTFGDSSKEYPLMVNEDSEGLRRAQLSISLREDEKDFLFPIVLPGKDEMVSRLVEAVHRENCHVGFNILWALLRKRFWLVGARRVIKRVIKSCILVRRCRRGVDKPHRPYCRSKE